VPPPRHLAGGDLSGFPNVTAHFKRMQERPSVKKLLGLRERSESRVRQDGLGNYPVLQTHAVAEKQTYLARI